jgi:hypothetical protein
MIFDLIIIASLVFAFAFFAAWLRAPKLRAWIERPKYRFQANVQSYDEKQTARLDSSRRRST